MTGTGRDEHWGEGRDEREPGLVTDRQTGGQTDRQGGEGAWVSDRQTDRGTDRQTGGKRLSGLVTDSRARTEADIGRGEREVGLMTGANKGEHREGRTH